MSHLPTEPNARQHGFIDDVANKPPTGRSDPPMEEDSVSAVDTVLTKIWHKVQERSRRRKAAKRNRPREVSGGEDKATTDCFDSPVAQEKNSGKRGPSPQSPSESGSESQCTLVPPLCGALESAWLSSATVNEKAAPSHESDSASWIVGDWIYARGEPALYKAMKKTMDPAVLSALPRDWDVINRTSGEEDNAGYAVHMTKPMSGARWRLADINWKGEDAVALKTEFVKQYGKNGPGDSAWHQSMRAVTGLDKFRVSRLFWSNDPWISAATRLLGQMALLADATVREHEDSEDALRKSLIDLALASAEDTGYRVEKVPSMSTQDIASHIRIHLEKDKAASSNPPNDDKQTLKAHLDNLLTEDQCKYWTQASKSLNGTLPDITQLYKAASDDDLSHFDTEDCKCSRCSHSFLTRVLISAGSRAKRAAVSAISCFKADDAED